MRILVVCPNFPFPPDYGGSIRIYNIIKFLSSRNDIEIIGIDRGEVDETRINELKRYCKMVHLARWKKQPVPFQLPKVSLRILKGEPYLNKYAESEEMAKLIYKTTEKKQYDIIQFEHSYSAGNIKYIHPGNEAKTVLSMHNICFMQFYRMFKNEKTLFKKIKYFLTWFPMFFWEPKIATFFNKTVVVSESDKVLLQALEQKLNISVVPNGVDTKEFQQFPLYSENKNILFVGSLDYEPNLEALIYFYKDIFPLIIEKIPNCKLVVVGKNPSKEVWSLARDPRVVVNANVNDVRQFYKESCVSMVSLRSGGGTRLKILESMALGIPVVSTNVGCEGLDVRNGHDILIADEPNDFAQNICKVLTDHVLCTKLAKNARNLVEKKYDWEQITQNLEEIYRELQKKPLLSKMIKTRC